MGIKGKWENVEYLGINDNRFYYKDEEGDKGDIVSNKCKLLIEIIDSAGKLIDFNCNSNTYVPKNKLKKIVEQSISPCLDTLYIKLKKEELEEMTDREYQYFLLKDEACMRYKDTQQVIQSQQSAAFLPNLLAVCAFYYIFFMWVFG